MGFSRQEYWSGLPCSSPGNLPNPGIKPGSPALQADSLPSEPPGNLLLLWGFLKILPDSAYLDLSPLPSEPITSIEEQSFLSLTASPRLAGCSPDTLHSAQQFLGPP